MGGTYEENSIKGTVWHTLIIDSVCKPFPQRHRTFVSNCKESSVSPFTCTLLLSETPWPLVAKSVAPETCIFLYKKIIQVRKMKQRKDDSWEYKRNRRMWKRKHHLRWLQETPQDEIFYETETCEWT